MEKDRVLSDASAYVLFEASGDSEAQHFGGDSEAQHSDAAEISEEEDDAQSCSHGSLYGSARKEVDGGDDDFRCADFDDCIVREEEDDGGGSDFEDGVVDQCRGRGKAEASKEKLKKSKGCEESSVKMMREREGDKLFWEACLASQE